MVVAALEAGAMRLVAADPKALSLGLRPRLGLADARARVPAIEVHEHEPEVDLALLRHIADWCDRYTPVVAEEMSDTLILEIAGSVHLFGSEARLCEDIERRLAGFGFTARTAIAGTSLCARAVARFDGGGIIRAGKERESVSALPVAALEMEEETTLALRRAGLMTVGDVAARPIKPLAARFGGEFVRRLAGVIGEVDPPLHPRRPLPLLSSEQRFADPIGLEEDIATAFDGLSHDLCTALEQQGQGGRAFEATFFRADGATRRIEALVGRPLRDPAALKKLFMTRLDALADPVDPGFGFDMIRLCVLAGDKADGEQIRFERDAMEEGAVTDLVDRLTARFGLSAVERFLPVDSHVPERAARRVSAITDAKERGKWQAGHAGEPPLRPILIFTPPQPVETIAEVPEGPPYRFRWRHVLHEITHAEGPERVSPEWWKSEKEPKTRDYYRVEDRQGHRYWLYREGLYAREAGDVRWFLQGLFP
ncbi:DNA polymerase Y family protein [Aliihoeflea aestuarii]|jgi:protein ImuB|uniref:Y-family DNA polymerase n=1 Tax=Aliihoeflea aestuarii TaxID=453840 RepID=UPI0020949EAD|nr:DNA polymerase Y family protein [Aliihoeflea aestuarii]MCO6392337.1 DNA polymerase Y family protein [Aliihoeflea aestuarii]